MNTYPADRNDGPSVLTVIYIEQACFESAVIFALKVYCVGLSRDRFKTYISLEFLGEETIYNTRSTSFTHVLRQQNLKASRSNHNYDQPSILNPKKCADAVSLQFGCWTHGRDLIIE